MPKLGNHCMAWKSNWVYHSSAWRNTIIPVICCSDKNILRKSQMSSFHYLTMFTGSFLRGLWGLCSSNALGIAHLSQEYPQQIPDLALTSASGTLQLHQLQPDYPQKSNVSPVDLPKQNLGPVVQEYLLQPISFSTSCCLCFLRVFPVHVLTNSLLQCQE